MAWMLWLSSFGLKDGVQQDRTALMLLLCAASGTYLELQTDHKCSLHPEAEGQDLSELPGLCHIRRCAGQCLRWL